MKLRKGTGLNSPGKIQVQQDGILQGSPVQLQSQLEQAGSQQLHLLSYQSRTHGFLLHCKLSSCSTYKLNNCLILPFHCSLSNCMARIPYYSQHVSSLTTTRHMAKSPSPSQDAWPRARMAAALEFKSSPCSSSVTLFPILPQLATSASPLVSSAFLWMPC